MILYFIRHAQSANNALYFETGSDVGRHPDPPLTEAGRRQSQYLARCLAAGPVETGRFAARHNRDGFGLTHVYTSLMVRAVMTAAPAAEAVGLPLIGWPELHERGGLHDLDPVTGNEVGVAGMNRAELQAATPGLILPDSLGEAGWWNRPPEREDEFIPRAQLVLRQLIERHGGAEDRVAVVSHGGFFQSILAALLTPDGSAGAAHLGFEQTWFGISNASISRFEIEDGVVVLRYLNRVDFLPDSLITG